MVRLVVSGPRDIASRLKEKKRRNYSDSVAQLFSLTIGGSGWPLTDNGREKNGDEKNHGE